LVDVPEVFLKRVLLVSDNETAGGVIRGQLVSAGYDVRWAKSAGEATTVWQPRYFDVVLVDLRREPDHGQDFVKTIKAKAPDQRVIFLREGRNGHSEAA
jgi:CheY-like chemotaxis protein